ncbi:MAG TPA: hypothetical protein VFG51_01100 [Candidatus Saccharimonadia bacterium]|nr:hypothetical protein [Candidatus Saccharimonadia bacterium]
MPNSEERIERMLSADLEVEADKLTHRYRGRRATGKKERSITVPGKSHPVLEKTQIAGYVSHFQIVPGFRNGEPHMVVWVTDAQTQKSSDFEVGEVLVFPNAADGVVAAAIMGSMSLELPPPRRL